MLIYKALQFLTDISVIYADIRHGLEELRKKDSLKLVLRFIKYDIYSSSVYVGNQARRY